ncbi:MAG: hypothetical protein AAF602_06765, partial [Myxococcota bacterium]
MMRLAFVTAALATGCAAPDASDLFNAMDVAITDGADVEARFLDAVRSASTSLHVALPDVDDAALLEAIGAAWDNGLEVQLVVDRDQDSPALQSLFDIGVPITLASDEVTYFDFALNNGSGRDVGWSSSQAIQSHAYVVVDRQRIVTATTAGHGRTG